LRRQIDRNKRAKAGLHVGDAEDEPIKPTQAFLRRLGQARARFRRSARLKRNDPFVTCRFNCCAVVGRFDGARERFRRQINAPASLLSDETVPDCLLRRAR
jgi:hypothetical protein